MRRPSPEREETDTSLRKERMNTDDALRGTSATAERHADRVVDRARVVADEVLTTARHKADHVSPRSPRDAKTVVGDRVLADRTVREERASADVALLGLRADQRDALAGLLVHERAATDAYLVTERELSDVAVANRDGFLGMVAHDVRNLLNGVVLSLELLRPGDEEPPAHVVAASNRIRRYVGRMNRLIGDLLDVTSIDAGKLAVRPIDTDAAPLVKEAAEAFLPAALEKGVTLTAILPPGPLEASFDHDRMLQVFANLIANAIKFTPLGGKVELRADETADGMLRFSVGDTGVGIAPALLDVVFERFRQGDENDRVGHGLGLYISQCIVEAHGGRIWAESQPGLGTRVYFTLPVRGSRRSTDPPTATSTLRRGNGKATGRRR